MAIQNLTRLSKASEKKSVRVSAVEVNFDRIVVGDTHQLFEIPKNALILESHVEIIEPSEVGGVFDLGFDGGSELQSGVLLDAAAGTVTSVVEAPALESDLGETVTIVPTVAAFAQGKFLIVVKYIEYNLSNGELTDIV